MDIFVERFEAMEWSSMSDAAIIGELGRRIKELRLRKRYTQQEIAYRAGISLFSIAKVESGEPVSISIFISVLRALRLLDNLEALLPEIGVSPVEMLKLKGKTPQRIRKRRDR